MKKSLLSLFTIVLTIGLLVGCSSSNLDSSPENPANQPVNQHPKEKDTTPAQPAPPGKYKEYPAMSIDTSKKYTAKVSTSLGDFSIELFAKDAPKTVNNFVFLAKDKFYDNLSFHRVIKGFMIQTGDPKGDGTGGPGYNFEDELDNGHKYEVGVVAMANVGHNTNGSQFFIGSGKDVEGLNNSPDYTIFGKVVSGMDVVEKISSVKVKKNPLFNEESVPEEPVTIKTITIEEK
ncbi:peptidylprolyl isomerase [Brevibacillus ruminantium]|uniref:Peptidyl-prolyl cis-trans isomerase n=1 Tax=Brevibacillus ruminantium TaxID=2950604 RepID=A0ABY4WMU7_9BACL|nr:peptidylprolyl isomerase [Brevibacillus ruminantium]USG68086.1 peptidylprolyl isomerase [Brevibacillus ruminantium]